MHETAPSLKLISLNIEGSKHLDRVLPFLEKEEPDVFSVQEIFESDIPLFESRLGMKGIFAPLCRWDQRGLKSQPEVFGTGMFSREPMKNPSIVHYVGNPDSLPLHVPGDPTTIRHAFLSANITKDGESFTVGSTHFVWTPDGKATDRQREALADLFKVLASYPEIVFSGDFNAPRGGEIFAALADRYKDNIPGEYTTSVDKEFHRAGDLQLMVDGLFTTPHYIAENTRLVDGLSDHMAILSAIRKA